MAIKQTIRWIEEKKWYNIKRNSKITLKTDTEFMGFKGKKTITQGIYYINGFWGDICGLRTTQQETKEGNKFIIPSIDLVKFEEIDNEIKIK